MKYLDFPNVTRLNAFLDHVDVGEVVIYGSLEAYSCKLGGLDKKLSRSLDQEVQAGSSPVELSMSPVGPMSEHASRKTLIYLILTLNHIYQDYDFSLLRAHHFRKESGVVGAEEVIDTQLLEVSKVWERTQGDRESFLETLWKAIDEAVSLKNCDVYSYKTDRETDPFGERTSVWCFNYFFYNKKLKRIVYLSCRAQSKASVEKDKEDADSKFLYSSDDETDYGMANEMDDVL